MELFDNTVCVSFQELTHGDPLSTDPRARQIISFSAMTKYLNRFPFVRVRSGRGLGNTALLAFDRLRSDIQAKYVEKYGDPHKILHRNPLEAYLLPDHKAATFFSEYLFEDDTNIKPDRQVEYNANATVLNAVGKLHADLYGRARKLSKRTGDIWAIISHSVNNLDRDRYPHSLPTNSLRLKDKFRNYIDHGYAHLIHKGIKNANAKKVNDRVERLILSLYCRQNLPFGTWVYDHYLQFLSGTLTIVEKETGEVMDRNDFFDSEKGTYITISRSTVWNIIHNPSNAIIIDRLRNNRIDHVTHNAPFNHRKAPKYSLSKISMDDRTLSRKTSDGKNLNVYMAFDVMSDAILGCVYSTESPSVSMVWDCFRDMYRTISRHGLMWPGEVEVENHLMKEISDDLNAMFGYVTFCAPGISRSKRAEHKIRAKKYGDEKMHQVGIGRWYGKGAYKTKSENKDEDYKQPRIPVEVLIAEDRESVNRFNHSPHPNQKMFPGKTRWEVLTENQNPDLGRPQKHKLFRYMGLRTNTSLRNNDFVTVQYEKYSIDALQAINRLSPNNYTVEAYYVPDHDGNIGEVFLYQGDTFITRATKIDRYQEAKIERTGQDEEIRTSQAKRQAHFFKVEREGIDTKINRGLEIIPGSTVGPDVADVESFPLQEEPQEIPITGGEYTVEAFARRAIDEI